MNTGASAAKRKHVVIADVPDLRALPLNVRTNATILTADVDGAFAASREGRLGWAFKNLREIGERARLVVTSRIHIALPAMAQGVPVVFVTAEDKVLPGGGGGRTTGLRTLFHRFDIRSEKWGISVTNPPPNPGNHQADRFRAAHWHYIKTHMPDAELSARVYGVIPFRRLGKGQPLVDYPTQSLFHLVLSTGASSVTKRMLRQAEQIFYHHPNAKVLVHTKEAVLEETIYSTLRESGYDVRSVSYTDKDFEDCFEQATGESFSIKHFKGNGTNKYWYSHETDLLRFCILYQEGGVYLDTDMHVIKPFPLNFTNSVGYQNAHMTNGAAMIFEKGSEFARAAITWIRDNDSQYVLQINQNWEIWGPRLITLLVNRFSNRPDVVHAHKSDVFQPIPWNKVGKDCFEKQSSQDEIDETLKGAYAVHLNTKATAAYHIAPRGTLCAWMFERYCLFCDEDMTTLGKSTAGGNGGDVVQDGVGTVASKDPKHLGAASAPINKKETSSSDHSSSAALPPRLKGADRFEREWRLRQA